MPRVFNKAFVIGRDVFVPHPLLAGLWIRTDLSVVKVACSYPECESPIGVPCRNTSSRAMRRSAALGEIVYSSVTHWHRRADAKGKGRDWKNLKMIIAEGVP
jgi:hypothetical protein